MSQWFLTSYWTSRLLSAEFVILNGLDPCQCPISSNTPPSYEFLLLKHHMPCCFLNSLDIFTRLGFCTCYFFYVTVLLTIVFWQIPTQSINLQYYFIFPLNLVFPPPTLHLPQFIIPSSLLHRFLAHSSILVCVNNSRLLKFYRRDEEDPSL